MKESHEEAIRVAVRVRPHTAEEETQRPWTVKDNSITFSLVTPAVSWKFDHVFDETSSNGDIYTKQAAPIVESVMNGINGTIFAYGQTSSGKTFTMSGTGSCPGIMQQAVEEIFRRIRQTPTREFLLRVSYLEIYNEIIRDLMNAQATNLKIKTNTNGEASVQDLKESIVVNPQQVYTILKQGQVNRHVGATDMNERSSRSHTILRIIVESRERIDGCRNEDEMDGAVKAATLSLVDLAGSERVSQTNAQGMRLKEGGHINKSLLTLGNCINKLVNQSPHIPYRDSKLTHILQSALGGNNRTVIICTISPAVSNVEESMSTIKFASRARDIKNSVSVNEIMDDQTMIKRLKREILGLKLRLRKSESGSRVIEDEEEHQKLMELKNLQMAEMEAKLASYSKLLLSGHTPIQPIPNLKPDRRRKTVLGSEFRRNVESLNREQMLFGMSPAAPEEKMSASVDILQAQLDHARKQIKLLSKEKTELDGKFEELVAENSALADEQSILQINIEDVESDLSKICDMLQDSMEELKAPFSVHPPVQLQNLQKNNDMLRSTISSLENHLKTKEMEFFRLKKDLNELKEANQTLAVAHSGCSSQITDLTARLDSERLSNETLLSRIKETENSVVASRNVLMEENSRLKDQVLLSAQQHEILSRSLKDVQERETSLQGLLEAVKSEAEQRCAKLKQELDSLSLELAAAADEKVSLSNENLSLREDLSRLEEEATDLQKKIHECETHPPCSPRQLEEKDLLIEKLKAEIGELSSRPLEPKEDEEMVVLQDIVRAQADQISALKNELSRKESEHDEKFKDELSRIHFSFFEEKAQLQERCSFLDESVQNLKLQLTQSKDHIEKMNEKLVSYTQRLQEKQLKEDIAESESIRYATQRRDEIKEELHKAQQALVEMEQQRYEVERERNKLKSELQEQRLIVEQLQSKMKKLTEENTLVKTHERRLRAEAAGFQDKLEKAVLAIEQLRSSQLHDENQKNTLFTELKRLRSEIEEDKRDTDNLKTALKESQSHLESLREERRKFISDFQNLESSHMKENMFASNPKVAAFISRSIKEYAEEKVLKYKHEVKRLRTKLTENGIDYRK